MHANYRRSLHYCLFHAVGFVFFSIAIAADNVPSSKEGCLLQQRTSSQRSSNALLEDSAAAQARLAPTTLAKSAPTTLAKSAPSSGAVSLMGFRPTTPPKSAPRSGSKAPARSRQRTSTTANPSRIRSTPLEDIVDEDFMSQRAELHLAVGLDALQESSGSLHEFTQALHDQLMTVDKDMDPKRLVILGARGQYLDSDQNASNPSKNGGSSSQIDFEVYPGEKGETQPGQFLKKFAKELRDKKVSVIEGQYQKAMWAALGGASLVVTQGSKVSDAATGGITRKEQEEEWFGSKWFPWEWYRWLLSDTQMGSSPGMAMLLPLASWAGAECLP